MADHLQEIAEAEAILRSLAGEATAVSEVPAAPSQARVTQSAELLRPVAEPTPPPAATTLLQLIEAVPDALVVIDAAGRIVVVNKQTEDMFVYRRAELLGQPIEVLVPERFRMDHVGKRDGYLANANREARPMGAGLELVGRRKDGREIPVEISLNPLTSETGLLVVASIRDVSERRRSVAHLRKVEARYRTLVEGIPAVTFMAPMDEGPGELYVSPQIEKLLGFSQREWVENPILWYTQLHPEDQTRWHEEFARTVVSGEPFRSVYRFVARDGRVVWVHGEAKVVRDESGRPQFLQGVAFDITGMKQAEEDLKALNATLEEKVAERTMELTRSNQVLGIYAGTAAHDLKAPLRTVRSNARDLLDDYGGRLEQPVLDLLREADDAARGMSNLIDEFLKYAKVRTEGKDPDPVPCLDALKWAQKNLRDDIREAGAEITAGELPTVLADWTQLGQLFQNLIGNSLKYRGEPPPRIHVTARRDGTMWVIEVSDNGIGIEPRNLAKIFQLGVVSRVDHRYQNIPGSGIGLATCEMIVQRHGGRIWATSGGLNYGTTISFTMCAAD